MRHTAALIALLAAAAHADVDPSLYEASGLRDKTEQQRQLQQIRRDMLDEARRDAERQAEEARAAEARRRAEQARPWPLRLTEHRCTLCHAARNYAANAHTRVGWWVVALRMKYVNQAPLGWDEMPVIVAHLSAEYPAAAVDAALECVALLAGLATPLAVVAVVRQRRRRR